MLNENLLTRQVEEYISYKRSLGYKIKIEAQELRRFAAYTRSIDYEGSLTSDLAVRWASLKDDYSRFYKARRLETLHTFAKYVFAFDSCAQLPQTEVFGKCHCRVSPYIYTDKEVAIHTFACGTIKRWLEAGDDVNQRLFLLSTYMSHVKPEETLPSKTRRGIFRRLLNFSLFRADATKKRLEGRIRSETGY